MIVSFLCCIVFSFSWIDKVRDEIQPYYIKCTIYKALDWVNGEIPGTVTVGKHERGLRIRAVPITNTGHPKTIVIEMDEYVRVEGKDSLAISIAPNSVLRAGTVQARNWTITFPPVVTKMNIKR